MRKLMAVWMIVLTCAIAYLSYQKYDPAGTKAQVVLNKATGDEINETTFANIDSNFTELYGILDGTTALTTPTIGTPTVASDARLYFGSGEGAAYFGHVSSGNYFNITPYDGGDWASTKELYFDADIGEWVVEGSPYIDGANITGDINLGAETSFEIPNGTDPDVTADGQISYDTDDEMIRMWSTDAGAQVIVAGSKIWINFPAISPQSWDNAARDGFPIFCNFTSKLITWENIKVLSSIDNMDLTVQELTSYVDTTVNETIETISATTDGTGVYTANITSIDGPNFQNGRCLAIDFDDTDDPAWVTVIIQGKILADD